MSRIQLSQTNVRTVGQQAGRKAVSQVVNQSLPLMKRMAPRSPAHLSGSGVPKPGARLADIIRPSPMVVTAWTVSQRIEARKDYAVAIHEGARRHRIPNRMGGKVLKFRWRRVVAREGGVRRIRPRQFSY